MRLAWLTDLHLGFLHTVGLFLDQLAALDVDAFVITCNIGSGHTTVNYLKQLAAAYPHSELLVLCMHTHSACDVQIAPNLRVIAGDAEYGAPKVQTIFLLD